MSSALFYSWVYRTEMHKYSVYCQVTEKVRFFCWKQNKTKKKTHSSSNSPKTHKYIRAWPWVLAQISLSIFEKQTNNNKQKKTPHTKESPTKSSHRASLESLSKSFVNFSNCTENISSVPYPQVLSCDILIATLWTPKEEARV